MPVRTSSVESPPQTPFNFEQQRKRARALLRGVRARDAEAIRRIAASHPAIGRLRPGVESISLHDTQLVIAREHGFATWADWKAHIHAHAPMSPLGSTSLVAAANRALETRLPKPLYRDPFAGELTGDDGWSAMRTVPSPILSLPVIGARPYLSITTRFFDDALRRVVRDSSITQVVILGAGMDTRAFRLEWPRGVVVFELDRDEVFDRKETILRRLQARPACQRQIVRTDLARSWGTALRKAGFDPSRRAAILLESVLLYLDESVVTQIFAVLRRLACRGSWIGLDVSSVDTLTSPMMTPFLNKLKRLGCAPWQFGINDPETFLAAHGWEATAVVFGAPEDSYGRWPYPYVPRGIPSIARAFLIQGWRSGTEGVWRESR